jgi:hypothetical protein
MVIAVEVTAVEVKDTTQGPASRCVRAYRASILKDINIKKVEIQRVIEPQGVRDAIRTFRGRCCGRIIPLSGCGGELLDVALGFCYLLSLSLHHATGSLGLGR